MARHYDIAALAAEIAQFSYRPGWQFSLCYDEFLGPMLRIIAPVQDGYNPGSTIDLGINSRLPPDVCEDHTRLGRWLLHRLCEVEVHECREMLRRGAHLVSDPHLG